MKQIKMLFLGSMILLFSACGGGSSTDASFAIVSPPPVVPSGELIGIEIEREGTDILAKGQNVQLSAFGIYADDSENRDITTDVQWISSDESIATVTNTGLLETHDTGSVFIHATLDGVESNNLFVLIFSATLTSITITPTNVEILESETVDFTATGIMSDGAEYTLDSAVSWSSSNLDIATIDAGGVATGLKPGTVNISATSTFDTTIPPAKATLIVTEAILESFSVTIPSTLENGTSDNLVATGTYDNGLSKDISDLVTWSSSDDTIASTSGSIVTGNSEGNVTISAEMNGIIQSSQMEVTPYIWWNHLSVRGGSSSSVIINGVVQSGSWKEFILVNESNSTSLQVVRFYGTDGNGLIFLDQALSVDLSLGEGVGYTVTLNSDVLNPKVSYDVKDKDTNVTKTFSANW